MIRRLALAALLALAPCAASAQFATIGATPPVSDSSDRLATTAWVNNFFALGIPLASGKIFIGSAGGIAAQQTMSGDCTLSAAGVITCTQSAGNFLVNGSLTVSGSVIDGSGILATNIAAPATPATGTTRIYVDSSTKVLTFKNDAGTVGNAVVPSTCGANLFGTSISAAGVFGCVQPAVSNISGFGTGVATALGVAIGSAGAPVLFNGAGGTPSSLALTNATGLPVAALTGLGTGVGTALAVNVGSAGAFTTFNGAHGTPSSITLTNGTGLPTSGLTGTLQAAQEPAHTGDMTNTAGSFATTVVGINGHLINGAWTTYTPTVACVSGTLTTGSATGRYQQFGKTVVVQMDISITTNGTCATGVTATLPFAANVRSSIVGKEVATTGFMVIASALPAGTTVDIRKYDATYPGGNSNELVMEGVFESQ